MMITPLSYEYLKAFSFYEKGSYPNGLAWSHESHKYIQAMMILDKEFNRVKENKNV